MFAFLQRKVVKTCSSCSKKNLAGRGRCAFCCEYLHQWHIFQFVLLYRLFSFCLLLTSFSPSPIASCSPCFYLISLPTSLQFLSCFVAHWLYSLLAAPVLAWLTLWSHSQDSLPGLTFASHPSLTTSSTHYPIPSLLALLLPSPLALPTTLPWLFTDEPFATANIRQLLADRREKGLTAKINPAKAVKQLLLSVSLKCYGIFCSPWCSAILVYFCLLL